jgi:hypothetical protein
VRRAELARAADEVKSANEDSGRLLTVFNVKLESVKKIGDADVTIAVKKAEGDEGPLAITRTQDPNITHPLRQMDVIEKVGVLHGTELTAHKFQAIAWKHQLKDKSQYCWRATEGVLTRYSNDTVAFVKSLTQADVAAAVTDYRSYLTTRAKKKAVNA